MTKLRIVIADDQQLILEGIRIIIDSQTDMEVVAIADNGRTAVEAVLAWQPDVVLLDIKMPGMSGIEALKEIKEKYPQTVVLMLTTFDPDDFILNAFKRGANGYLLKDVSGEKLALAIRDAFSGNITIPASIAARIIAQIPKETRKTNLSDYNLTSREIEIAKLIAKGYNNEKMIQTLGISMGTVKNYISSIYSKLEANSRQEAIYILRTLKNIEEK